MIYMMDPGQNELFDHYQSFLSPVAYKRLTSGYHAVFRHVILSLLPAAELAEHFDPTIGRPTKELYSMAGLVLLKEYHNWTTEEAAEAYMFDGRVQYALNLGRDNISFCERSLERYMKLIREDDLAGKIFDDVTAHLVKKLEIKVDQQRLDSTHVFSDMATFSRTKLMGVTIKRFLLQLKRHHAGLYEQLPEEIRTRYEKRENAMFADASKDKEKRSSLRSEVAEQMHNLIQFFAGNSSVENMTTFKQLLTVFDQQCEVLDVVDVKVESSDSDDSKNNDEPADEPTGESIEDEEDTPSEVIVRKKTGGNVIQNPSDPEATYDGHKGVGYQVQLSETSNPENEVQLITSAIPETAAEADANAVEKVLDDLERKGMMPNRLLSDSAYGGDDNVVNAAQKGVDIVSPVAGLPPKKPPTRPTEKQIRLQKRRELQETGEWRIEYNIRAQVEGTIGSVKRRTGMVRLRYRGQPSMYTSIYLKLAGWNISRATASRKIQEMLSKRIARAINGAKQLHEGTLLRRMMLFQRQEWAA
ncbi:MAG: transposase [Deltaproteobacteria bacterium]|nr:transposase [Deltaproteobacteria bacterium]